MKPGARASQEHKRGHGQAAPCQAGGALPGRQAAPSRTVARLSSLPSIIAALLRPRRAISAATSWSALKALSGGADIKHGPPTYFCTRERCTKIDEQEEEEEEEGREGDRERGTKTNINRQKRHTFPRRKEKPRSGGRTPPDENKKQSVADRTELFASCEHCAVAGVFKRLEHAEASKLPRPPSLLARAGCDSLLWTVKNKLAHVSTARGRPHLIIERRCCSCTWLSSHAGARLSQSPQSWSTSARTCKILRSGWPPPRQTSVPETTRRSVWPGLRSLTRNGQRPRAGANYVWAREPGARPADRLELLGAWSGVSHELACAGLVGQAIPRQVAAVPVRCHTHVEPDTVQAILRDAVIAQGDGSSLVVHADPGEHVPRHEALLHIQLHIFTVDADPTAHAPHNLTALEGYIRLLQAEHPAAVPRCDRTPHTLQTPALDSILLGGGQLKVNEHQRAANDAHTRQRDTRSAQILRAAAVEHDTVTRGDLERLVLGPLARDLHHGWAWARERCLHQLGQAGMPCAWCRAPLRGRGRASRQGLRRRPIRILLLQLRGRHQARDAIVEGQADVALRPRHLHGHAGHGLAPGWLPGARFPSPTASWRSWGPRGLKSAKGLRAPNTTD
ncbi:unnamed protein product [Prorocentrum cordatum]|uniref:Uncharacterized protein n=1 Tax=Prorocentrum cordatum TaxID=2364126 RepID=A0ABN9PW82_9DINO|nr:unnamed protein product [Polarella glacialis]